MHGGIVPTASPWKMLASRFGVSGGAWDRSTHLGVAENYDAACTLAEAKQAEWLRFRERPSIEIDGDQVLVVRAAQRPDEEPQQLAALPSMQAASDYLSSNYPRA